jgi:choline dehydrogenase-like flavoprotein
LFFDARTLPENRVIETDVCIVGAGAAGITLAREFAGEKFRVCLLESGGLELDEATQSLYKGDNVGLPYFSLDETRFRYFGGTTSAWKGACRPLDEMDFEKRPWVPYSGWPFGKSHLDPYYERAQSICQLGPFAYNAKYWEDGNASSRLPMASDRVITTVFQFSPPTRFGEVYREEVVKADNIATYLNANVVEIETNETARSVVRLRVVTLEGNGFWVSGKLFILATGGIETPRLLLTSTKVQSSGLGNKYDLVGRFFIEHPHLVSGIIVPSDSSISLGLYGFHRVRDVRIRGALALSEEVLRREKMLNFGTSLRPVASKILEYYEKAEASKGVGSYRQLRRSIRQGNIPEDFWHHLWSVIADVDDIAIHLYGKMFVSKDAVKIIKLVNQTEQAPNPDSRVTLSEKRDRLGMNRVRLNWRLSEMDKRSLRRAHEIIGQELGRAGLGRLKVELDEDDTTWPPYLEGGHHHMGTTRMHVDPKHGVVDEDCRVHGISNLFVAGPSVFPTCGYANPMLTIVALSLRLADHVKKVMG